MSNLAPLMSSAREDWNTPYSVLELVREVGPIVFDPCSNPASVVGAAVEWQRDRDGDSLARSWPVNCPAIGLAFVNPPYGRTIGAWLERCHGWRWSAPGREAIALVHARTDTRWFQEHARSADALCFWKGRIRFGGGRAGAPFPSLFMYWGSRSEHFAEVFAPHGLVLS